ncbi:helicase, partial [Cystoisospora suis]
MDIGRCINAVIALAQLLSSRLERSLSSLQRPPQQDSHEKSGLSSLPLISLDDLLALQSSLSRLDSWISNYVLDPPTANLRHRHAILSLQEIARAFEECSNTTCLHEEEEREEIQEGKTHRQEHPQNSLFSREGRDRLDQLLASCVQTLQEIGEEEGQDVDKHLINLDNLRRSFHILYADMTWENSSSYRVY